MENVYWNDRIVEDVSCGYHHSRPEQCYTDVLASLPQSDSLVIELDLQGIKPPEFFSLPEASSNTIQPQKPETAQIFLCASSKDTRSVFQSLQIRSSGKYIERVSRHPGCLQCNSMSDTNGEVLMEYDPRCLVDWLSIQPGQVQKVLLPEYVKTRFQPSAKHVVRSQVHITRGAENRYTAVWFDFRDEYKLDGEATTAIRPSDLIPPQIPASTWQRRFACRFQGLISEPIRHATDFPGLLLLDLLTTDVVALERIAIGRNQLRPVATHAPVVKSSLERRLSRLEFTQSMIRKAEDMHRFVTYMKRPQALNLIAVESRTRYEQSLDRLDMESSLLISELKRRDELADKRLEVYKQFAQQRQASSISALTYCAAFFLPLSLAGTFLSMQSRAKDLHLIVYNFCGITTVFCTIAALIYFVSWALSRDKTSKLQKRLQEGKFRPYTIGWSSFSKTYGCVAWTLVVSSFLVGMLHNLRLGLIMLAIPPGLYMLPLLCAVVVEASIGFYEGWSGGSQGPGKTSRARQSDRDDIEAGGSKDSELSVV